MRKTFFLLVLMIFALTSAGCGNSPPKADRPPTPSLVWPSPPETPRIKYLYSISKPEDIGITPSLSRRIWGAITGEIRSSELVRPYGVFAGADGTLCVTDPGARVVHVFNENKRSYEQIRKAGKQELLSPIGIAMHADLIYVSDSILGKIFVFDLKGNLVEEITGEGRLHRPTGIAVHPGLKMLYVADAVEHCVQALDLKGNFLFQIGKPGIDEGEFNFPTSVAVDRTGNLYVNDSMNFRIQVFEPNGRFLRQFGKQGDAMGEFSSGKGVALDSEGHIYVADAIFDAVQIFDGQGELLLFFGESGHEPGEFWIPTSIHIDPSDRIFVCDSYTQRIQVFQFLGGK